MPPAACLLRAFSPPPPTCPLPPTPTPPPPHPIPPAPPPPVLYGRGLPAAAVGTLGTCCCCCCCGPICAAMKAMGSSGNLSHSYSFSTAEFNCSMTWQQPHGMQHDHHASEACPYQLPWLGNMDARCLDSGACMHAVCQHAWLKCVGRRQWSSFACMCTHARMMCGPACRHQAV